MDQLTDGQRATEAARKARKLYATQRRHARWIEELVQHGYVVIPPTAVMGER